jgi:peptidoglycan/xylan/chitin deacetylase (PgdA/CDA1 family)
MSVLSRTFVPALALGLGTWLGLGRPDAQAALSAGAKAVASVTGAAHELAPKVIPPPPLERTPASPDVPSMADPPPPWPQLNPEDTVERAWLVAEGPAHAPNDGKRLVTFTFDDGPFPETAPTVLRILDEHRIRATFFLIGKYLAGDGEHAVETRMWAKRIADAGHYVGNHTMDHRLLPGLPHAQALQEIDDSEAAIERATGKHPVLFRPPYGEMSPFLEAAVRDRHYDMMLWNIDVEDMKKDDPDAMVKDLLAQLEYKHGGIVLLHDVHWPSVKAFNRLLRVLEANRFDPKHPDHAGWSIVDLPEYLKQTAASPQPYASREELEKVRRARNDGAGR